VAATSMTTLRPVQRIGQIALLLIGLIGAVADLAQPLSNQVGYLVAGGTFAFTGWLLTTRRPDNGIGWCFLGVWALIGCFGLADVLGHAAAHSGHYFTFWAWLGGWLVGWMWGPLLYLATTLPLLLFPEGFRSRRWRWVAYVGAIGVVVSVVVEMVSPELAYFRNAAQQDPYLIANNPLSPPFLAHAGSADNWLIRNLSLALVAATAAVAGVGVVLRARKSSGVERLQFRWVAYGACVLAVGITLTALPMFRDSSTAGAVVWASSLAALPVTMALAILRFRLYDIDRVVSRTTSYALVTGLLLTLYALIVTSASRLLHTDSPLVVAGATLAAAALARPALRRVQAVVDRRFDRAHYDALRTVDAFGARLRDEVDPDAVLVDLSAVVRQALQPQHAAITLVERR
jgi:hypothetical protein